MTDAEQQRYAKELRRDRITVLAVGVLIGALLVIGAALAGSQ